jgi:class 3 adenylate cyclase
MTPQVCMVRAPGYEWALTAEEREEMVARVIREWGRDSPENPWLAFGGGLPGQREAMARYQRLGMGPGDAEATLKLAGEIDVRHVLGSIQCPTLVMRRRDDRFLDERHSRYVAEHIPGARYVELEGDTPVWVGDRQEAAHEIQLFLTGTPPPRAPERVLATVLFTDIVGSTELAARLGDARWRELLLRHDEAVREEVSRGRGRVVKSLGDGALATFDGPSRAIETARSIGARAESMDLRLRAGLHAGECELMPGGDVGGMAVHIAARIAGMAAPGEILLSSTVRDLTIGSALALESRGEQRLKGVAEPWRLYAVVA